MTRLKHMATSAIPKSRYSVHAVTNSAWLPEGAAAAPTGDGGTDVPSKIPMVARAAKLK